MADIQKPLPEISDLTKPFWDATRAGELRMQKCTQCGHLRYPVGPVCTSCLSPECEWVALSGNGTVLAHLVFHQVYHAAWKAEAPYSVIMVQLDEGPRMFSDIEDPEHRYKDVDLVGQKVAVAFRPMSDEIVLPWFRPVE
jgi:uncharacterized OB-fold protein